MYNHQLQPTTKGMQAPCSTPPSSILPAFLRYRRHSCRASSGAQASPSYPLRRWATSAAHPDPATSSVDEREAGKFARLADRWWDPLGPFRPLHQLNPVRCRFIRAALCDNFRLDAASAAPLAGLRILDVGCGGGLLGEALARMGADVEGIDVNQEGLAAAAAHAALDPQLETRLRYRMATVEDIVAAGGAAYDAVIASEVIEHVASVPEFCAALVDATAPGGAVVVSTMSRTLRSYALAIVAAERVLGWVPPGTHEWSKFLNPEEVAMAVEAGGGAALRQVAGMVFDPFSGRWALGRDTGVNYIAYFQKQTATDSAPPPPMNESGAV